MPVTQDATDAPDRPAHEPRRQWWTQSISDGGGHYGHRERGGAVRAACGEEFDPLPHAITGEVEPMTSPADKAHACPACWAAWRGSEDH